VELFRIWTFNLFDPPNAYLRTVTAPPPGFYPPYRFLSHILIFYRLFFFFERASMVFSIFPPLYGFCLSPFPYVGSLSFPTPFFVPGIQIFFSRRLTAQIRVCRFSSPLRIFFFFLYGFPCCDIFSRALTILFSGLLMACTFLRPAPSAPFSAVVNCCFSVQFGRQGLIFPPPSVCGCPSPFPLLPGPGFFASVSGKKFTRPYLTFPASPPPFLMSLDVLWP